jgi:hypothetical protein
MTWLGDAVSGGLEPQSWPYNITWTCESLTAACMAFSLANAKGKGTNGLLIRSLD